MCELIEVFKMEDLSLDTRISVIKKLGRAINYEYAANVTDEIVDELVSILETVKKLKESK